MAVEFLPSGDAGLTVQFGHDIDRKLSRQIMALRGAVDDAALPGVIESVPTYRSLLIHYDPLLTCQTDLIRAIKPLLAHLDTEHDIQARCWTLPICFDANFAPDLANVAAFANMAEGEVQSVLTSMEHFVYMLGFAPGLPYMGDLPEALAIPRRTVPVKRVEKGSVLVATGLTIIYPAANPTGWHVVGRCPVPLFELDREEPVLLSPGDRLRFRAVNLNQFQEIGDQVAEGTYQIEQEVV